MSDSTFVFAVIAVAAALMLGVADPDASGIGGITYMLINLADRRMTVIDGTPPVPQAVEPARLKALEDENALTIEDCIRMISARKADRQEVRQYYQGLSYERRFQ